MKLRKAIKVYREKGLRGLAQVLTYNETLPEWLLKAETVEILRLDGLNQKAIRRQPEGYRFGLADRNDLDRLLDCGEGSEAHMKPLFQRFFDANCRCFIVEKGSEICGYNWGFVGSYLLTLDDYASINLEVDIGDDSLLFGNGFIRPEYRLKGLFPHMVDYAVKQDVAIKRFLTSIDQMNINSVRSHRRLGFVHEKRLDYMKLAFLPGTWTLWNVDQDGNNARREGVVAGRVNV